ncbi:hypothetical protein AURDEDRAFT_167399 [Auricularia subglabra TFB-10046 SS5]|nr:hypothetical protein AURDEDRAFT_167399 [Auricularia subglabra TFB-10046 SS5]
MTTLRAFGAFLVTYVREPQALAAPQTLDESFKLTGIRNIQSSWTRGFAITPVATAVTFVAFLLSFSGHFTLTLSGLVAGLLPRRAAHVIAFICDVALYAWLKAKLDDLDGIEPHTNTGASFWLTFAALILLLLGGSRRLHRLLRSPPRQAASGSHLVPAQDRLLLALPPLRTRENSTRLLYGLVTM